MRKLQGLRYLCITLSFFFFKPMAYAESDAKYPDLGSGQLGGCNDELCAEEIFRSDEVSQVCIRVDARDGGLPSLKVAKGNHAEVIAEWNELVGRTVCVRGSSVIFQCQPAAGADGVCLYRIVQIK